VTAAVSVALSICMHGASGSLFDEYMAVYGDATFIRNEQASVLLEVCMQHRHSCVREEAGVCSLI